MNQQRACRHSVGGGAGPMKPLFLIGFMGAGKTTLGRALESEGFAAYVDLDDFIEEQEGMSIAGIFSLKGEVGFREIEARALRCVGCGGNVIVGCGGGTPCYGDNMEWMNRQGITVCLRASHPVLLRRLLEAQNKRPLLKGMTPAELSEFIDAKQIERELHYGRALLSFCSDRLESRDEIAQSCLEFKQAVAPYLQGGILETCLNKTS